MLIDLISKNKPAKALFKLFISDSKLLTFGLIAMLGGASINLVLPYVIKNYINESVVSGLDFSLVLLLATTFASLFAFQAICFFVRSYTFNILGHKVVCNLRSDFFNYLISKRLVFFDQQRINDLVARLQNDTVLIQDVVSLRISVFIRYAFQIVGGLIFMVYLSPTLSLASLLVIPILVAVGLMLVKKLKKASKSVQENLANAGVKAEESLSHIETVKAFALENSLGKRYQDSLNKVVSAAEKRSLISAFFSSFVSFLINICLVAILCFGLYLVFTTKTLSIGELTAFILYGLIVALSLALFANSISEISSALAAIERIKDLVTQNFSKNNLNSPPTKDVTLKNADIEFKNVNFSYSDREEKLVLNNINLKIKYGSHTAIIGQSGSGKSTLVKLILGFYKPTSGQILIGEVNSENVHPLVYGSNIAYLPQEPGLFAMSILENLKIVKPEATINEIEDICEKVNILDFIKSLPEGFNTDCGERDSKLSGGQKQRIALARALLKNPDILVLDEPSSALDAKNELQIYKTVKELMRDKTLISISHRLNSLSEADQVILLENGELIISGSHNELNKSSEIYQQMTKN